MPDGAGSARCGLSLQHVVLGIVDNGEVGLGTAITAPGPGTVAQCVGECAAALEPILRILGERGREYVVQAREVRTPISQAWGVSR